MWPFKKKQIHTPVQENVQEAPKPQRGKVAPIQLKAQPQQKPMTEEQAKLFAKALETMMRDDSHD